ncbi:hypothetical protein PSAC2689_30410 [Paraburkholderia sacchari]|uniref:hypothetical protein n=1 Tax=Paraburkholderia sacchari TaxID=159450 RepID=UPI0039A5BD86
MAGSTAYLLSAAFVTVRGNQQGFLTEEAIRSKRIRVPHIPPAPGRLREAHAGAVSVQSGFGLTGNGVCASAAQRWTQGPREAKRVHAIASGEEAMNKTIF